MGSAPPISQPLSPTQPQPPARPRLHRRGPAVRQSVVGLLDGLGGSEADVSRSLDRAGAVGSRGDPRDCAIARYLGAVVGAEAEVTGVSVGRSVLWVTRKGVRPAVRVSLPPAVRRFIMAFDAGLHPELERSTPTHV